MYSLVIIFMWSCILFFFFSGFLCTIWYPGLNIQRLAYLFKLLGFDESVCIDFNVITKLSKLKDCLLFFFNSLSFFVFFFVFFQASEAVSLCLQ